MGEKILVVDDEAAICDLLYSFLTREKYDVTAVTSAQKALEILKTEKPKVMLIDIKMPKMNGLQLMKKVREIDKDVIIVVITAVVDKEAAEEAVKWGAVDYIVKPFDLDYLKTSLSVKLNSVL